jgi:hypothetical protein
MDQDGVAESVSQHGSGSVQGVLQGIPMGHIPVIMARTIRARLIRGQKAPGERRRYVCDPGTKGSGREPDTRN